MTDLPSTTSVELPSLRDLGYDLLEVNFWQKCWTVAKPFFFAGLFFVFAGLKWPVPAFLSVVLVLFHTYVSSSHDLVHNTLRLPLRWNRFLLFLMELIAFRSGHAFKLSHVQHHRSFPEETDIEGESVHGSFWAALASGPFYTLRIYFWALKRANGLDRTFIYLEGLALMGLLAGALLIYGAYPPLLWYLGLCYLGSWVYPMFTVYIPHLADQRHAVFQTRRFRGLFFSTLFAHHNYHLEHHLYPGVPHQNWRELGRRLDPYLEKIPDLNTVRL